MSILKRTVLLAAILTCAAGTAGAEPASGGRKDGSTSTTSMGAGGLTGTGATRDGARAGPGKGQTGGTKPASAPAAGTTR